MGPQAAGEMPPMRVAERRSSSAAHNQDGGVFANLMYSKLCVDESCTHREPKINLADNLLRDFEDRWWKCCREVRPCQL